MTFATTHVRKFHTHSTNGAHSSGYIPPKRQLTPGTHTGTVLMNTSAGVLAALPPDRTLDIRLRNEMQSQQIM
ncbi:hypothetical protein [Streptomyces avermitilis]|uniref:hypothetical protein n=1 Tax=Streptomyces avermitilis TaxID=33903 RepID=UPI0036C76DF5